MTTVTRFIILRYRLANLLLKLAIRVMPIEIRPFLMDRIMDFKWDVATLDTGDMA